MVGVNTVTGYLFNHGKQCLNLDVNRVLNPVRLPPSRRSERRQTVTIPLVFLFVVVRNRGRDRNTRTFCTDAEVKVVDVEYVL